MNVINHHLMRYAVSFISLCMLEKILFSFDFYCEPCLGTMQLIRTRNLHAFALK